MPGGRGPSPLERAAAPMGRGCSLRGEAAVVVQGVQLGPVCGHWGGRLGAGLQSGKVGQHSRGGKRAAGPPSVDAGGNLLGQLLQTRLVCAFESMCMPDRLPALTCMCEGEPRGTPAAQKLFLAPVSLQGQLGDRAHLVPYFEHMLGQAWAGLRRLFHGASVFRSSRQSNYRDQSLRTRDKQQCRTCNAASFARGCCPPGRPESSAVGVLDLYTPSTDMLDQLPDLRLYYMQHR